MQAQPSMSLSAKGWGHMDAQIASVVHHYKKYSHAAKEFMHSGFGASINALSQYADHFKTDVRSIAKSQGHMTDSQAGVYAEAVYQEAFPSGPSDLSSKKDMLEAAHKLSLDYPDRSVAEVHKMAETLQKAATAGKQSGSYLTSVRAINTARQPLQD